MYARYNIDQIDFWKKVRRKSKEWTDAKRNVTANYYNIVIEDGILWTQNRLIESTMTMLNEEGYDDLEIITHADITIQTDGYNYIIQWENYDFEKEMRFQELTENLNYLSIELIDMIEKNIEKQTPELFKEKNENPQKNLVKR